MNLKKISIVLTAICSISAFSNVSLSANEERMVFSKEIWEQNQENPLAQFYIGEQHYLKGNYNDALKWFIKAAHKGLDSAIMNSQIMIKNNQGTSENMESIVGFLTEQALDENNLFAQLYLGDIYRNGDYKKDFERSFFWYTKAMEQGNSRAEYYVGNMLVAGVGTAQNVPRGLRVLERVADKGHSGAIYNIGKTYKTGYNIAPNYNLATNWFERGANEGHVASMYELADNISNGFGAVKDQEKALEWFETAALHGHTRSAYKAGMLHLMLEPTEKESFKIDKGMDWLRVAADEGSVEAQLRLGDIFYEGKHNIEKDYQMAVNFYKMAAEQNEQIAYKKLSLIYRIGGHGIERNDDVYKDYIEKYYRYDNNTIKSPQRKIELFNYNIFDY